jgi:rhodanese-related sulfurtransferase
MPVLNLDRSCQDVKARQDKGEDLVLIDVREPAEVAYCAISGSVHIPLAEIPRRMGEIDKARETVILCHTGGRSTQAALFLRARGFDNVYNLAGGIDAWSRTVDPGVPRYR